MTSRSSLLSFVASFVVVASAFVAGCAGADDHAPRAPQDPGSVNPSAAPADNCASPAEGCPCTPGDVAACRATRVSGNYVSCSEGNMTCGADGKFGSCVGDSVWVPVDAPQGQQVKH